MTAPQHPIPTAKGRAYVAWRDAPDRDHEEDDEPIVAFSAGWEARDSISAVTSVSDVTDVTDGSDSTEPSLEAVLTAWYTDEARGTHLDINDLPSLVNRIEAHYASMQPPTREQIAAEALRDAAAALSRPRGAPYEVWASGAGAWLRERADALLSQQTPPPATPEEGDRG
ncbi:hypothetical protein [Curtobacterium sp. MCSS17_015]|uniref:hypothetical protein n=1 Tax=Curtobacterium sp. MCSS17_015 TaxID=2175666 RepID=UPI000DA99722|nr:hypothetical protein [Curtobacterium sp. MCSS17_015]WIB25838.1 hypothetical protein DEJ18_12380 [Curtobacterium sp. MCSS17_015]